MHKLAGTTRLVTLFVTLAIALAGNGASATPPLDSYGQLPSIDHLTLSPDGKRLALVAGAAETRQIQIRDTDTHKAIAMLATARSKLRYLMWAGNSHLIIVLSATAQIMGLEGGKREYLLAADYDLARSRMTPLLAGQNNALNTIVGPPTIVQAGGHAIAYLQGVSFLGGQGVLTLFRNDLDTRVTTVVARGSEQTRGFLVDSSGEVVAREDYEQRSGRWSLWTGRRGQLRRSLAITAPLDEPSLEGFGRDQQTLMVASVGADGTSYQEIAVGQKELSAPLEEYAGGALIEDRATRAILAIQREGLDQLDYQFLAKSDQALWAATQRALPGAVVSLRSWSDDRSRLVLQVEGGAGGAAYYLLDRKTLQAAWLADEYAEIGPDDTAPVRSFHYPAADGTPIPAYLTLPRGAAPGGRLPLVVLVHGGPAARDDPGFDWWSQALASRGYAVLQPQYRGSRGFGRDFMAAGYGQWGRKMQSDVSDGVASLVKAGTADQARVCIVGASYGGYAALAGVTLQSGIYACAVSLAGPADLRRMMSYEKASYGGAQTGALRYWQRFMGAASPGDPALDAISPARLAQRASVPILLIHGQDDTVVPYDQSRAMADALRRAGKTAELVTLKGEDHWLSRSETRRQMLVATAAFLGKHLPTKSAAPAGPTPTP